MNNETCRYCGSPAHRTFVACEACHKKVLRKQHGLRIATLLWKNIVETGGAKPSTITCHKCNLKITEQQHLEKCVVNKP